MDPAKPDGGGRSGLGLDAVRIALGGRTLVALDRVVAPGTILTVMGPSGSGKSTLLSYVGGFLDPAFEAAGRVLLDGRDITALPPQRRRCGLLFQDALLFPHLSVGQNLRFVIPRSVGGRAMRRRMAAEALAEIGLAEMEDRDPETLSGGQKARVALARVLLSRPSALLLDEPFSKLDVPLRAAMRDLVFGRIGEAGLPAILVTHDEADAKAAAGPVLRIGEMQGHG